MPRGGGAHPAIAGKLQKKQNVQKYRRVDTTFVWKVKSNTELSFWVQWIFILFTRDSFWWPGPYDGFVNFYEGRSD